MGPSGKKKTMTFTGRCSSFKRPNYHKRGLVTKKQGEEGLLPVPQLDISTVVGAAAGRYQSCVKERGGKRQAFKCVVLTSEERLIKPNDLELTSVCLDCQRGGK